MGAVEFAVAARRRQFAFRLVASLLGGLGPRPHVIGLLLRRVRTGAGGADGALQLGRVPGGSLGALGRLLDSATLLLGAVLEGLNLPVPSGDFARQLEVLLLELHGLLAQVRQLLLGGVELGFEVEDFAVAPERLFSHRSAVAGGLVFGLGLRPAGQLRFQLVNADVAGEGPRLGVLQGRLQPRHFTAEAGVVRGRFERGLLDLFDEGGQRA